MLHNFTVESQVQFHAPLAFEPTASGEDGEERYWAVDEDQMKVFVNSEQWTLGEAKIGALSGYSRRLKTHLTASVQFIQRSCPAFHPIRPVLETTPFEGRGYQRYATFRRLVKSLE